VLKGKSKGKKPLWLFGHSMGGLVSSHMVARNPGLFDKVTLSAPMLDVYGLEGVPSPILRFVAFFGDVILGKGMDFVPGAGTKATHHCTRAEDGNDCTSSQPRLDNWNSVRERHPVVVVGGVTWGWLHASNKYRLRNDTVTAEECDAFGEVRGEGSERGELHTAKSRATRYAEKVPNRIALISMIS